MDAFVSHTTALEVLRRWDLRGRLARGERCVAHVPPRPPSGRELEELLAPGTLLGSLPRPIDVLVADGRGRTRSCDVRAHLQAGPLPEGSAVDLGEGLYIHSTAASGGVVVNSLDPASPLYRADLDEKMTCAGSIF